MCNNVSSHDVRFDLNQVAELSEMTVFGVYLYIKYISNTSNELHTVERN